MSDERFLLHQMRSMKIATRVGAILLGGIVFYRKVFSGYWDVEVIAVMTVMALVKLASLYYFKRTN
ncbi:MAG TPA: hypothetical protein VLA34_05785 [Candidatus Krumholzibacterium sp.]|nr:hypothetical protein [Candidatus Krumholzibacterium sp.]